jgi:hypothetical protein
VSSFISSKTSGPALIFISAALLLFANSASAAQPVADSQELVRQFLLGGPIVGPLAESAPDSPRVDAPELARRFILGRPDFGSATESNVMVATVEAPHVNVRVESQEQVRQFLLGKPSNTPVSEAKATSALSAPRALKGGSLR